MWTESTLIRMAHFDLEGISDFLAECPMGHRKNGLPIALEGAHCRSFFLCQISALSNSATYGSVFCFLDLISLIQCCTRREV